MPMDPQIVIAALVRAEIARHSRVPATPLRPAPPVRPAAAPAPAPAAKPAHGKAGLRLTLRHAFGLSG
ncbi:hypothetical protein [Streptomyces sp. NPDC089919]|uniref:hypothetical protein n=1 Tax=Streptomyces sp. NPDC089919 TaxID=3155188 RepID=UPI0034278A98